MAIPGGVKRGKPRSAPKKVVVKVAPEATRPVTVKQRKAIDKGVERARKQQFATNVAKVTERGHKVDTTQAHAKEVERRINSGKLPLVPKTKVIVKNGKLYAHDPMLLGLTHHDNPVKLAGSGFSKRETPTKFDQGVNTVTKKVTAPAVKILDLSAKPGQAIGKKVEKATGSKALGFAGSILLDPTTYLTFGRSKVASVVASRAGRTAYKGAIKSGAVHKAATKAGDKAAEKAATTAPQNHGLVIRVGRHSTSGKTTAYISRKTGVSKVATKVRESKPVQGVMQDLRPDFKPKGVSAEQHTAVRAASREARAETTRGRVEAISKAQALKKHLKPEDHAQVVNAIERGTVYNLPEHLRTPAREVEQSFRQARKAEVKAGIKVGNRRHYFSHALDEAGETAGRKAKAGGKRVIKPVYGKARQHEGTIEQIKATGGPEFSTNVPHVVAGRLSKSAGDVAQAKMNRALANAGRTVQHGEKVELGDGEALYKIHGSDIQHLSRWEEEHVLAGTKKPPKKGDVRYVVLNNRTVDEAVKSVAPGASRSSIGRGYDKVQGGFKFVATVPNPGFHLRNLYGDTFNAYLGQGTVKLAGNVRHSAKGLRALGKQEEAARKLTSVSGAGNKAARRIGKVVKDTRGPEKGITVPGKHGGKEFISYDKLAREAVTHGAIRSGFISREIPELLRDTSKAASGRETGRHFKRLVQNREDLIRLATYIGARKGGKTAREASDWAAKHHFDYADLTDFERTVMRRLLPFYTFSARNIPLQASKLITNPGKFANIEKIRDQAAQMAGLPNDWQSHIAEYQQRGVPIPIVINGEIQMASPSLPLSDLNQLTLPGISADNIASIPTEQMKKFLSMLNPVIKSPVELFANYNFFFRGQIERDESPLVAAPSYVSKFPADVRKKLGIVSDYVDKRSGEKGWGWPGKVDYAAKVMPGIPNFVQQMMSPLANRRGQDTEAKLLSFVGGVKVDPYDPVSTAITNLYDRKRTLEKRRSALSQRRIGSEKSGRRETPEYRKIQDEITAIDLAVGKLSRQRGDKIPVGKVRKPKGGGSLITQSSGPSVSDILGHDAPTLNDILGS